MEPSYLLFSSLVEEDGVATAGRAIEVDEDGEKRAELADQRGRREPFLRVGLRPIWKPRGARSRGKSKRRPEGGMRRRRYEGRMR